MAQSTALEADTFLYTSLSRRVPDLLDLLCILWRRKEVPTPMPLKARTVFKTAQRTAAESSGKSGAYRDRTDDLLLAGQLLCRLS